MRYFEPGGDRPYITLAQFETRLLGFGFTPAEVASLLATLVAIEAKLAFDSGLPADSTVTDGSARPDGVDHMIRWFLLNGEVGRLGILRRALTDPSVEPTLAVEAPAVIAKADTLNFGERHGPVGNRTRTGLTRIQAIRCRWALLTEQVVP